MDFNQCTWICVFECMGFVIMLVAFVIILVTYRIDFHVWRHGIGHHHVDMHQCFVMVGDMGLIIIVVTCTNAFAWLAAWDLSSYWWHAILIFMFDVMGFAIILVYIISIVLSDAMCFAIVLVEFHHGFHVWWHGIGYHIGDTSHALTCLAAWDWLSSW